MAKTTGKSSIPNLTSIILFLVYVAVALNILRYRMEIAEKIGVEPGVVTGLAIAAFLAVTVIAVIRNKNRNKAG